MKIVAPYAYHVLVRWFMTEWWVGIRSSTRESRISRVWATAMSCSVASPRHDREVTLCNRSEHVISLGNPVADDVDDLAFLLETPTHGNHGSRHNLPAINLETVRPKDALRHSGFILDRDEKYPFGRAGPLPDEDDTGDLDIPARTD